MSSEAALSARAEFTRSLFAEYEAVRGVRPGGDGGAPFWDMVVITAGAEAQKSWYEEQAWTTTSLKHCRYFVQKVSVTNFNTER